MKRVNFDIFVGHICNYLRIYHALSLFLSQWLLTRLNNVSSFYFDIVCNLRNEVVGLVRVHYTFAVVHLFENATRYIAIFSKRVLKDFIQLTWPMGLKSPYHDLALLLSGIPNFLSPCRP
jgi:hypothetical protein